MDPLHTLAVLGVVVGGLAQSITGMGFALVAAPVLIALLGPTQGVAVVVLLGTLATLAPLLGHWRAVRARDGVSLLIPSLIATPVVGLLVSGADTAALAVGAGVGVLAGVTALWRGLRWRRLVSVPGAIGTGISSAVLNVIGGVGGPPVGLYAANAGWEPRATRATLQAIFLVQGVVTVVGRGPGDARARHGGRDDRRNARRDAGGPADPARGGPACGPCRGRVRRYRAHRGQLVTDPVGAVAGGSPTPVRPRDESVRGVPQSGGMGRPAGSAGASR